MSPREGVIPDAYAARSEAVVQLGAPVIEPTRTDRNRD